MRTMIPALGLFLAAGAAQAAVPSPATGVTEVISYNAVDDLGFVVSPQLVQGQVHGGVLQGAGHEPQEDNAERSFARLVPGRIEELLALLAEIRAERDRLYAPFLAAFAER